METITIPSPSAFLSSPAIKPAPERPPLPKNPKSTSPGKPPRTAKKQIAGIKPKQSKSRNGCVTCKSKRLKCDETKPACEQCHKRGVMCGGYKKDFKWRPFEEATFVNKVVPPRAKRSTASIQVTTTNTEGPGSISANSPPDPQPPVPSFSSSDAAPTPKAEAEAEGEEEVPVQESFFNAAAPSPPLFDPQTLHFENSLTFDMSTPPYLRQLPRPRIDPDSVTSTLSSLFDDTTAESPRPSFAGRSPRLIDLLLPGSELNARPGTVSTAPVSMSPAFDMALMDDFSIPDMAQDPILDEDVEEIVRGPQLPEDMWMELRDSLIDIPRSSPSPPRVMADFKIFRQPEVQAGSPEMLMLRFDKQTCGILSVKDGPTENPWRTLVWPLARDSPALYHAIASMTAFHTSKERPALRVDGMEHMRRSIRSLATGIDKMRTDTALATTLVLAFSESWDQHISTGIEHLRGARILVNQALVQHSKRSVTGDDLARLKFLCNTWVYMDVIARLTSVDDNSAHDVDYALEPFTLSPNFPSSTLEVDPLLGCAATLFPLIGRAANLCRRVLRLPTNSIQIISCAIEIKEAIEAWHAPPSNLFERPEDPTSEIQHALQTAEAYRYATLLYLHQAVPEIPSLTSAQLAKKVLVYLATVPLSSRLVIVQIYPLLAAGCEASSADDRQWVEERWQNMARRMCIGNIDRCWEVMQEVWARRDAADAERVQRESARRTAGMGMVHSERSKRRFEEEMAGEGQEGFSFEELLNSNLALGGGVAVKKQRTNSFGGFARLERTKKDERPEPITEEMDPELTVRGRLHWVGVMRDWDWEILLG